MKIKFILLLILLFLKLSATIINIPADHPTIQEGINASVNADTVLVQPGTYIENINYNGKNITLASSFLTMQDTSYISQTIIDGNQNGSVVTFENEEDSTAVLIGFTITNGSSNTGGGIVSGSYSNPSLKNLIITNNFADNWGGGLFLAGSNLNIEDLVITNNFTDHWASGLFIAGSNMHLENIIINNNNNQGMFAFGENMLMQNCEISNNIGAGIIFDGCSYFTLNNVTISENSGDGSHFSSCSNLELKNIAVVNNTSQGIYSHNSDICFINTTITNNYGGGIYGTNNSNLILINCIMYNDYPYEVYFNNNLPINHMTVSHSDIEGGNEAMVNGHSGVVSWLEGNIDSDPLFVDPDYGDFHLQNSSPCIGTGIEEIEINGTWYNVLETDIEGTMRPTPVGSNPDIGAYENLVGILYVSVDNTLVLRPEYQLANHPNPFNPTTTIYFEITNSDENNSIEIYNIKGQKVKSFPINQFTS